MPLFSQEEGGEPVRLFNNESYSLNPHMYVLEDKTNALTIDQVASSKYASDFQFHQQDILNLGITQSTYWIKTTLNYPNMYPNEAPVKTWYLELGRANIDIVELFKPEFDGTYQVITADMRTPYKDKNILHVNSIIPITMMLGQEQTLYLKIKNETSLYLPVTLWTPDEFIKSAAIEEFLYGLFYGGMLILVIYNIFIYFSVKDISYLYYVLYLAGIILFELLESGHGMIHFDQLFGTVKREYILIILSEAAIAAIFFAKHFVNTKTDYPKIDAFANFMILVTLATLFITLFTSYKVAAFWNVFYLSVYMPIYLSIVAYCWKQGNQNAKYFFFAWTSNIFGLLVFCGVTYHFIPATPWTLAATPIGILIESVALSFALANRIKVEQASALAADSLAVSHMSNYQSAFDNALGGMYKMTANGDIVNANPALVKLFGFSNTNELILHGRELSRSLFSNIDLQFRQLIYTGETANELRFKRADNRVVWASHNSRLIVKKNGEWHIEGTVIDITQVKLKDRAIKNELKERIAREIAEASTNSKSEFLANMSHEIRTPLTAIIGFSETLQEPNLSKTKRDDAISHVVNSSNHLLQLINDILDFSKIEAEKLTLEKVPFNLENTISALETEFSDKASNKNIQFSIQYRYPYPSKIIGDPTRIYQVLHNLCSNAVKFTDQGKVDIDISWDKNNKHMLFSVTDTGLGIEKNTQESLFQVFDQADTSATRQYGGAGLGLAISKKLAIMMQGDISIVSSPGKGSRFTFSVPCSLPGDMKWIQKRKSKAAKKQHKSQVFTGTILLAEDNIVNQKLIGKVLGATGAKVIIASNGVEACNLQESHQPDLILMDINMPIRDGLDATKILRESGCNTPIYALSAETDSEEINKALAIGCNGFLCKPLEKDKLQAVLNTWSKVPVPKREIAVECSDPREKK